MDWSKMQLKDEQTHSINEVVIEIIGTFDVHAIPLEGLSRIGREGALE
jgi:hypothetical protein